MSTWADIAAKNAPPEELQPHPDTSLLEVKDDSSRPSGQAVDYEAEHVHVVDRDEADKLREAMSHADESHVDDDFAEARRHQEARDLAAQQARLKAEAQKELKQEVDVVEAEATKSFEDGKKAVEQGANEAGKKVEQGKEEVKEKVAEGKKEAKQTYEAGKKEAKELYAEGKKDAKEFANKVEKEAKKDAKKIQKKASEVEKEGRKLASEYPYAASGIVGAINVALIAVPAFYAYQNWNKPHWDRRIVSAVAVGLTAAFGAESALGWFEYKQGHTPRL